MKKYDFLIVGAGLYGATLAWHLWQAGKKCLVIEKRSHIAGNIYTENVENIDVHKYGAHIFHTNNEQVWRFILNFGEFNGFINSPLANYNGVLYNLPFNMNTFYQMWGTKTPKEAHEKIEEQKKKANIVTPINLEQQAISLVGIDIYKKLIKGYTEKQWGRECSKLPPSIIKRIPVRFTFDNNYFNAKYQGIPICGYTNIIEKMLGNVCVLLNTDYFDNKNYFDSICNEIIFTGPIDKYFDYRFGTLEYRKVRFDTEILEMDNYQGVAVINYTGTKEKYTRIIEHKHFTFGRQPHTVISKEYSETWHRGDDPFYPLNDEQNITLYRKYSELAKQIKNVKFGGRLGEYKYYDMDKTIESAIEMARKILL